MPHAFMRLLGARALTWKVSIAVCAVLGAAACTPADDNGTDTQSAMAPPAAALFESSNATAPDPAIAEQATLDASLLPVYWLGGNGGSVQLYREFLPAESSGDPIAAAVWAMTSTTPLDSDYFSPWQEAGSVSTSISPGNVITVDISSDAFAAGVSADLAVPAVQQLVYTATAAAANSGLIAGGSPSSVVVLVDGRAGYSAFGLVELGTELLRDPRVTAPVWIINPQNDVIRDQSTVVIQGSGVSGDSKLTWRIDQVDDDGKAGAMVKKGLADIDAPGGSTGLFEFTIALQPGSYLISVYDTAEGNPDEELHKDTKVITIR